MKKTAFITAILCTILSVSAFAGWRGGTMCEIIGVGNVEFGKQFRNSLTRMNLHGDIVYIMERTYYMEGDAKKLYSTYLSYLPKEKASFPLKMNVDERGSFTELVHTLNAGQVSINISKPGITKGQHWHNTKFEQFIVVKGHGLIQQRNLNDPSGVVLEWEVSGDKIEAVHMLPGYTHNIINLSETEDLVTVMYCNEVFNPDKPDTFFEPVK